MTSTDLANRALEHIGVPSIDDITSTTNATAIACNAIYDTTRQEYIRLATPSRTRKEVALAIASGETSSVYSYVYGYPSDCLITGSIYNPSGRNDRIVFQSGVHSNGSSNVILTNQVSATLIYTADISNLNLWAHDDVLAFSYMMAMKLANSSIKRDLVLQKEVAANFKVAYDAAQIGNLNDKNFDFYSKKTITPGVFDDLYVANKALRLLSLDEIDDIDDVSSKEARHCKAEMQDSRDYYLKLAAPGFARKELALSVAAGETSVVYSSVYDYPADCLKPREIYNATGRNKTIVFEFGSHSAGTSNIILTDQASATLIYTKEVTDLTLFGQDDIDAIAYHLAAKLAILISKDANMSALMSKDFAEQLALAMLNDRDGQNYEFYDNRPFNASVLVATDIANRASRHLGVPPIDLITDKTNDVAIHYNEEYAAAIKTFLEDVTPGFARKELTLVVAAGETSTEYDYVYTYPTDCLMTRELYNDSSDDRIVYEEATHSDGINKVILTDTEDAELIYTQDITDLTSFSDNDLMTISYLLASRVGLVVPKDVDMRIKLALVDRAKASYIAAVSKSKTASMRDQNRLLVQNEQYITVRG